jgi:(hydroxyamino)benzene mutase
METLGRPQQRGHRLLQVGMFLFLLSLLAGLAIPTFAVPRLGLSAHLVGIMQALFLMVMGLLWAKLQLSEGWSRAGFWLAVYGAFAPWTANILGAVWSAGNTMLPMAAGQAHGSSLQEGLIAVGLRTGGASLIALSFVVLWGLRVPAVGQRGD